MTTEWSTMGDAAFAANLDGTSFNAVAGYLHSGYEFHPWAPTDWLPIPGPKLPTWVAGFNGLAEAEECLDQLAELKVPLSSTVALDMETRIDPIYVSSFASVVQHNGYKVWVYGSKSTLFSNPKCDGYWVADYLYVPFMSSQTGVRATQWTDGPLYDQSTVKPWHLSDLWQ